MDLKEKGFNPATINGSTTKKQRRFALQAGLKDDEWKDIADLLYYEYMQGAAAPEVVAELYPRSTR